MGLFDRLEQQRQSEEQMPEGTSVERELKRAKFFGWRDVVICLLIVGFFLLSKNSWGIGDSYGGLKPVLEETQFGITGLDGVTHTFVYAEADAIELHDDLKDFLISEKGDLVDGKETRQTNSGVYHNDAFGDYQLHVQIKLNNYILVRDANGVLVFNLESDDTTKELHRYIMELRGEQLANAN